MTAFIPDVWSRQLLQQLKRQHVMVGEPFIGPQRKPEPYTPVEEGSYLSAVLQDELWSHVPDDEVDEAVGVMIAALNAWIQEKKDQS